MEDVITNCGSVLIRHITQYPVEYLLLYLGISIGCFSVKLSTNTFGDAGLRANKSMLETNVHVFGVSRPTGFYQTSKCDMCTHKI